MGLTDISRRMIRPASLSRQWRRFDARNSIFLRFSLKKWPGIGREEAWKDQDPRNSLPLLSHKKQRILELIAEGRTSNEIAGFLGLSIRTVEHHRESIKKKLNLSTTADLIRYAFKKEFL